MSITVTTMEDITTQQYYLQLETAASQTYVLCENSQAQREWVLQSNAQQAQYIEMTVTQSQKSANTLNFVLNRTHPGGGGPGVFAPTYCEGYAIQYWIGSNYYMFITDGSGNYSWLNENSDMPTGWNPVDFETQAISVIVCWALNNQPS